MVDVVVTNGRHGSVHGLTAADFTLKEGGVPQAITTFEEHKAVTRADATSFTPAAKLPPGIYTNILPAPVNGAVNLVLLDSLNTPKEEQAHVRIQLLKYLKSIPPGTNIAILGLSSKLFLLQGFTSDPEILKTQLLRSDDKGAPMLDRLSERAGLGSSTKDPQQDLYSIPEVFANLQAFNTRYQAIDKQLRAKYTLDAMRQIARYLAVIPGRKNLIWFSASFPINILSNGINSNILPNEFKSDQFDASVASQMEFRETIDMLARARVAVYPIDAQGLHTEPQSQAIATSNPLGKIDAAGVSQGTFAPSESAGEEATMRTMAAVTGGTAYINSGDFSASISHVIDEGSNFYTLAYTPTNTRHDGKFRKIRVQTSRSGLTLGYREGYYADDPDRLEARPTLPDTAVVTGSSPGDAEAIRIAMTRGSPAPTEVRIKVGVVPMNPVEQPEAGVAEGNRPAASTRGPFRRYSVNCAIEPGDLTFVRSSDGKVHSEFETMIVVFDPLGSIVNSANTTIRLAGSLDEIRQIASRAILRHEEISVPTKGQYFIRIAVRDIRRNKFGAIELPTSDVSSLVPHERTVPDAIAPSH